MACSVHAEDDPQPLPSHLDRVQITATRFAEQVQEVPQPITVIAGDELRARGATDLRAALSLIGGVTVAPGGDAGPAGAVPGLLGLREVDDLLLLIDGIPSGGAFLPSFESVSLNNVERIEVLRGSTPVYFGTTAFAGTINIVHYAAGQAEPTVRVSYGSYGSFGLQGAAVISDGKAGGLRQSVSGEITGDGHADARAGVRREQLQYRAAAGVADGTLRLDLGALHQHQRPNSPSPVDDDGRPVASLSRDFNQNPSDGHIDTDRWQLTLGYERALAVGQWGSTLSVTRTRTDTTRGFLNEDYADEIDANATGFTQNLRTTDVFFDTHLTSKLPGDISVTYGLNELYGRATQDSRTFTYFVPLDGGAVDSSAAGTSGESSILADTRRFFGAYTQAKWQVLPGVSLLGGLRWNRTHESRNTGDPEEPDDALHQTQDESRWSGTLGASWKVWSDSTGDFDDVTVHAGVGNTFQPPQIDFGPDADSAQLLKPETMRHVEFGIKVDGYDGRLDLDVTAFVADFANQTTATVVNGTPALVAAGKQRFKGVAVEGSFRVGLDLSLTAHASYNDARYRDYSTLIAGIPVQLAGNGIPMSPRTLAGAGVVYAPPRGWRGSLIANHVGSRWVDSLNTQRLAAYTTADASLGYAFDRFTLSASATNIRDRRDPVLLSELGEGQLYRLPGRRFTMELAYALR